MRDAYWDIVKGIGIIAVVVAHANILVMEINWFHLELFFFVSGFLFSEKKCLEYGNFFLHKLKTLWKPFVMYNALFFILHNFFINIHWITNDVNLQGQIVMFSNYFSVYEIPKQILYSLFNGAVNTMCGATWFMAPFFSNILIFALIVKFSYGKPKFTLSLMILIVFILGIAMVKHSAGTVMYVDMAMTLLPITAAGFYLKNFCRKQNANFSDLIFKYKLPLLISVALPTVSFYFLEKNKIIIGLGGYGMKDWFPFLIGAFSGICFTLILAKLINSFELLGKIVAFIGEKSFHIMALHFIGFKFLTSIYVIFNGEDFSLMSRYTLPEINETFYVIFGVIVPLILMKIYQQIIKRFKFLNV